MKGKRATVSLNIYKVQGCDELKRRRVSNSLGRFRLGSAIVPRNFVVVGAGLSEFVARLCVFHVSRDSVESLEGIDYLC